MKYLKKSISIVISIIALINLTIISGYCTEDISQSITSDVILENGEEQEPFISAFSSFEEISKEDFLSLIDNNHIASVGKYGTYIYSITDDNKHFIINDTDGDLIPYLSLLGKELVTLTLPEKVVVDIKPVINETTQNKTKGVSNSIFWYVAMFGFSICIAVALRKKMSKQPVVNVPASTANQAQEKAKTNIPTVKFEDVQGVDELKADIFRLVDCLKNPQKYRDIGARTPKGVILYGPPGTGKTLIAKAIAGEAGVPFLSAVGSDFVEKYVGVGAKRVRELYAKARQKAPCIVFIDEVDAVAAKRGDDSNSENDQTINALLAELDGFKGSEGIITICATNRLDLLDDAFKRAGRFDLKLAVGLPDKKSREKILEVHAKSRKLDSEVNLEAVATKTAGFSGAELEALLNEAAMHAVGEDRTCITNEDIEEAFFKIVMQGNKKRREKITEMNKVVAWHEAGHTLATKLMTEDSVPSVTIVGSSSGAGGVTFRTPKDEGLQSKKYLKSIIGVMYAGRAAEEIYFGNDEAITNGASQDIKQATNIIKEYLALYGMGEMGMLDMTQLKRDFGEIIDEASRLSRDIYNSTLELLKRNRNILENLATKLLEKETLDEHEIDTIIWGPQE